MSRLLKKRKWVPLVFVSSSSVNIARMERALIKLGVGPLEDAQTELTPKGALVINIDVDLSNLPNIGKDVCYMFIDYLGQLWHHGIKIAMVYNMDTNKSYVKRLPKP